MSVFVSFIANSSDMINMFSGDIFSANTLKSLFFSVCSVFTPPKFDFAFFGQKAEVHRTVGVGTVYIKPAEVNGTKTKSLRCGREKRRINAK